MTKQVGIIGTGFGAKVHLPALMQHPDFTVVTIAGRNPEKTKTIATENGINHTTNWRDLTSDPSIEIIAISTPPYHHFEMAKRALFGGKHILLEKPTTSNALQAKELLKISMERKLIGMMCHEFRWIPTRNYLAHLVGQEKRIGEIREIQYNFYMSFAASNDEPKFGWLWDSIFDGGMLGAIGSHLVDQVRHTTTHEFNYVSGRTSTRIKKRLSDEGDYVQVTADDGFSFLFTMDNGAEGSLNVTTTMDPAPPTRFVISGNEGTVYSQDESIYLGTKNSDFEKIEIPTTFQIPNTLADSDRRIPPFLRLLDQFSKSLDEGKAFAPNLVDGWRNQQVLDAVRRSQKHGKRIKIDDFL